jgi:hypothetical protein
MSENRHIRQPNDRGRQETRENTEPGNRRSRSSSRDDLWQRAAREREQPNQQDNRSESSDSGTERRSEQISDRQRANRIRNQRHNWQRAGRRDLIEALDNLESNEEREAFIQENTRRRSEQISDRQIVNRIRNQRHNWQRAGRRDLIEALDNLESNEEREAFIRENTRRQSEQRTEQRPDISAIPPQVLENITREDQYRDQHGQRMQDAAQRLGIEVPNQTSSEWSSFAARAYEEITDENNLDFGGSLMLGDILREGVNHQVSREDRNSDRYKELMDAVLIKWRDRNNI